MVTRNDVVSVTKQFHNVKQGSKKHKQLVDIFNKAKINAGYGVEKGNYSCAWCAITATAILLICGFKQSEVPMSYNCGRLIERAKKLGLWVENDNYTPKKGDEVIYYWDAPRGDCNYGASHVGIVTEVKDGMVSVFEGNKSTTCKTGIRTFPIGWQYIRGFIKIPYETKAKPSKESGSKFKVGVKYTVTAKNGLDIKLNPRKKDTSIDCIAKGYVFKCKDIKKYSNGNIWLRFSEGWVLVQDSKKCYVK